MCPKPNLFPLPATPASKGMQYVCNVIVCAHMEISLNMGWSTQPTTKKYCAESFHVRYLRQIPDTLSIVQREEMFSVQNTGGIIMSYLTLIRICGVRADPAKL